MKILIIAEKTLFLMTKGRCCWELRTANCPMMLKAKFYWYQKWLPTKSQALGTDGYQEQAWDPTPPPQAGQSRCHQWGGGWVWYMVWLDAKWRFLLYTFDQNQKYIKKYLHIWFGWLIKPTENPSQGFMAAVYQNHFPLPHRRQLHAYPWRCGISWPIVISWATFW